MLADHRDACDWPARIFNAFWCRILRLGGFAPPKHGKNAKLTTPSRAECTAPFDAGDAAAVSGGAVGAGRVGWESRPCCGDAHFAFGLHSALSELFFGRSAGWGYVLPVELEDNMWSTLQIKACYGLFCASMGDEISKDA
jgi:hypothetical protein